MTPRASIAALAAAVLSVWAALSYFGAISAANRTGGDPYQLASQISRYAPAAAAVPPGTSLGYLTDSPLRENRGAMMYSVAQYVMAPSPIRTAPAGNLVLGNFAAPADYAALGAAHGLQLQQDFGNGVVLYRRKNP